MLLKFLQRTYQELCPRASLAHLATTAETYFSNRTPLWWVEWESGQAAQPKGLLAQVTANHPRPTLKVGCLWMGTAIDQCLGYHHSHILLLYVDPQHRRLGLGRQLMKTAENWARKQGDPQLTLQVFVDNQAAIQLYQTLGYQPQALTLVKSLSATP